MRYKNWENLYLTYLDLDPLPTHLQQHLDPLVWGSGVFLEDEMTSPDYSERRISLNMTPLFCKSTDSSAECHGLHCPTGWHLKLSHWSCWSYIGVKLRWQRTEDGNCKYCVVRCSCGMLSWQTWLLFSQVSPPKSNYHHPRLGWHGAAPCFMTCQSMGAKWWFCPYTQKRVDCKGERIPTG